MSTNQGRSNQSRPRQGGTSNNAGRSAVGSPGSGTGQVPGSSNLDALWDATPTPTWNTSDSQNSPNAASNTGGNQNEQPARQTHSQGSRGTANPGQSQGQTSATASLAERLLTQMGRIDNEEWDNLSPEAQYALFDNIRTFWRQDNQVLTTLTRALRSGGLVMVKDPNKPQTVEKIGFCVPGEGTVTRVCVLYALRRSCVGLILCLFQNGTAYYAVRYPANTQELQEFRPNFWPVHTVPEKHMRRL